MLPIYYHPSFKNPRERKNLKPYTVVSQTRGDPIIDPKISIILVIGIPKKVPLIWGNPHTLTLNP